MLNPTSIKPAKGAVKKRKTVGRGNSSGHGTYSCRGMKGQKSRSGASGFKKLGLKSRLLQIPKLRGFKSKYPNNQVINLSDISANFKEGESVNVAILIKKKLISDTKTPVKVLGNGELTVKNLKFSQIKISASAKEKIEKASGSIQ